MDELGGFGVYQTPCRSVGPDGVEDLVIEPRAQNPHDPLQQ